MKVWLNGKTNHGKNRVREHGNVWKVVKKSETVFFSKNTGPFLLLHSEATKDTRWVSKKNDVHFEVNELRDQS